MNLYRILKCTLRNLSTKRKESLFLVLCLVQLFLFTHTVHTAMRLQHSRIACLNPSITSFNWRNITALLERWQVDLLICQQLNPFLFLAGQQIGWISVRVRSVRWNIPECWVCLCSARQRRTLLKGTIDGEIGEFRRWWRRNKEKKTEGKRTRWLCGKVYVREMTRNFNCGVAIDNILYRKQTSTIDMMWVLVSGAKDI